MTVQELIDILKDKDPTLPVVIRSKSDNHVDDFIDLLSSEVAVIEARKIECPVADKNTYDASIHAAADTRAISLTGKSITRY